MEPRRDRIDEFTGRDYVERSLFREFLKDEIRHTKRLAYTMLVVGVIGLGFSAYFLTKSCRPTENENVRPCELLIKNLINSKL